MATYAESLGSTDFTCEPVYSPTTGQTCVTACGAGSTEVNDVCNALPGLSGEFLEMYDFIGYGGFACNLFALSNTTCGCERASALP
eukprot:132822-Chlamydomonas_euryale.AAC.1